MVDFNLSNLKHWFNGQYFYRPKKCWFNGGYCYTKKDVKEFIKQLKDEMGNCTRGLNNKDLEIFYKAIDKLAGEDLI